MSRKNVLKQEHVKKERVEKGPCQKEHSKKECVKKESVKKEHVKKDCVKKEHAIEMTHSVAFFQFRHHDNRLTMLFPDHSPEVTKCLWQRTLKTHTKVQRYKPNYKPNPKTTAL